MAPAIPIRNVFYLLSYAFDFLPSGKESVISLDDCSNSLNLLTRLLASGVDKLESSGRLDRDYIEKEEELARPRGRLLVAQSYRHQTHLRARLICRADELSFDTLNNRILKATLEKCLKSSELDRHIRNEAATALAPLREVTSVYIDQSSFRRVQLHRNNRHYRFLLNICHLIQRRLLPSSQAGHLVFHDFIRDDREMARIFERFVLKFAQHHFPHSKARKMTIQWDADSLDELSRAALPQMETDVTIEHPGGQKIILDCKFYKSPLREYWSKTKLRSDHLYQLFSYLKNKESDPEWRATKGVLLYPLVSDKFNFRYSFGPHPIEVLSLPLNERWDQIEEVLLNILGSDNAASDSSFSI